MRSSPAQSNYRDLLKRELEIRCQRNVRYSLRSFARDLEVSPARLSDVLRGRYGLSRASALKIAESIGWNKRESSHFADLVESEHARNSRSRLEAKDRLSRASQPYTELTLDAFQIISDWYHYAILELMGVEEFISNAKWIAKRLGLSELIVKQALLRLERLNLIEITNGSYRATDSLTASSDGVPSRAIKSFHRQVLEKALSSIDLQTVNERNISSVILAFDTDRIAEAARDIQKFRREFDLKYASSKGKNEVYCLALQFFSLETQRVPKKTKKESNL